MCDLPRLGIEPVSPAEAGRLTTEPPGKPLCHLLKSFPGSLTKDLLYLIDQNLVMWLPLIVRKTERYFVAKHFVPQWNQSSIRKKEEMWVGLWQMLRVLRKQFLVLQSWTTNYEAWKKRGMKLAEPSEPRWCKALKVIFRRLGCIIWVMEIQWWDVGRGVIWSD